MLLQRLWKPIAASKGLANLILKNCTDSTRTARLLTFSTQALPEKVEQPLPDESAEISKKLLEFFDDEKNWGEERVRVGRSWKKEELRIKSSTDLHKLWYILLKEKNMLLTMEHECNEQCRIFPNPERIDKVLESMHHLEEIVRERNQAYNMLETGKTGERPTKLSYNQLGMRYLHKMTEHFLPKFMNSKHFEATHYSYNETNNFLKMLRERLFNEKRKAKNRDRNHITRLFRRFPNMDVGYLKELYPDQDIDKIRKGRRAESYKPAN